jgi:hydroxymethylpyrimidine pyrophosphatase-like HAD family hydrolase
MPLSEETRQSIDRFLESSRFASRGAVFTDLDGTAVHEIEGRLLISEAMERGLKRVYDAGRPVVLNSLRFPLSVLRAFGAEWYRIAGAPIPTVCLNGSLIGRVIQAGDGSLAFDEIEAHPLREAEVKELLEGVRGMLDAGADELLVFAYPRDWREGEILWTPRREHVPELMQKYASAAKVEGGSYGALEARLLGAPHCMLFLLIEAPQDRLMAYQHTRRSQFVTHSGVDKRFGAERIAAHLGVELADSVGAGDTELDTFLCGVGLAVLVGAGAPKLTGLRDTLRVESPLELGEVLARLAERGPDDPAS